MDTESELEVARVITEDAGDVDIAPGDSTSIVEPLPASPTSSTASLKRPAGDMDDEPDIQPETSNKRRKRESVGGGADESGGGTDAARLVREMEVELGCPCCSALCYNPVIALPCQHYFCGSCYTMWTRYTGVTCPTCRQAVNQVIPSRAIQSIIEVYLRSVPSKARLPREMEQADEIYTAGSNIRIPTPRPRSPELAPPQDNDAYYRPCPHCNSSNDFNWACPQPIIDPSVDISRASLLTNGPPPGHALCGSCEHLHAIGSPSTSRCDFCRKTFCGLVSPQRCHAKRVREAKPALLEGLSDLILTPEAYPSFGVNTVEWEYLVDYLRDQGIGPRHIYVTIVESVLRGPEKWKPLFDLGMFPAAVAAALNDTQQRQRNVETDSASTSGSEAGAAGGSDEQQDDDNSRDAEMPEEPHRLPDTSANPTEDALISGAVPQPPTSTHPASNSNPEQLPTPLHDTEMPDVAPPPESAPAELVIPERPADAIAAAGALVDATDSVTSPVETRAITPISVPTPQLEVDNLSILLDSAAAEFVLPFEVEPISVPPAPHVATDNSQEPEGSPSTSDSASGTAVTSISSSESVPSVPPSNSNEGSTDLSPTGAAQGGASNPDTNSGANTSTNAANPSSRPRAVNLHLSKICRACALEVFYWGAKQWWIKERANAHTEGTLPRVVRDRKDCPDMFQYVKKEGEEGDGELVVGICPLEDDHSHAREFNHIPRPLGWVPPPPRPPTPEQPPESAESTQGQPTNTSPDGQGSDGDSEDEEIQIPGAEMIDVVLQQSAAVSDAAAVSNSASAASSTQDPILERPAGETDTSVSTISPTASTTVPGETPASGGGNSASHAPSSVDRMEIDIPSLPTSEDRLIIPPAAHTERHTEDIAMTSSAAGSQAPAAVQA